MLVTRLLLRDLNRGQEVLHGLVEAVVVEHRGRLEIFDREVVRLAVILVRQHATTSQAHGPLLCLAARRGVVRPFNTVIATKRTLPLWIDDLGLPGDDGSKDFPLRLTPTVRVDTQHGPTLVVADVDFGSARILFQRAGCPPQLAIENKSGVLFVYDRNHIADGPSQRLQISTLTTMSSSRVRHGLSGRTRCMWRTRAIRVRGHTFTGWSRSKKELTAPARSRLANPDRDQAHPPVLPVAATGVVHYGDGTGSQVLAFDAIMGAQLWASPQFDGPIFTEPIVVNGRLYAGAWMGSCTPSARTKRTMVIAIPPYGATMP